MSRAEQEQEIAADVAPAAPSVYFDSSVLIDYWVTDGMELESDGEDEWEWAFVNVLRELRKADRRLAGLIRVRKALLLPERPLVARAVSSPFALLEVIEWYAESAIKELLSEAVGARAIQRTGKKEVGKLLSQIFERRQAEIAAGESGAGEAPTGLGHLVAETFIGPGFAQGEALAGIAVRDVKDLSLATGNIWGEVLEYLAYLQMGMADILHLLVAQNLGCRWFASFDSDFDLCKGHIRDGLGMIVLTTPDEIYQVLAGSTLER